MPEITIDNLRITVSDSTTILEAARQLGIIIPTLCHQPECRPETSCLVCQVRLLDANRPGAYKTVPACATKAAEGMIIDAQSPEVQQARRAALELLLSNHRGDCTAPCSRICPTGLDIPRLIRAFADGKPAWAESIVFEAMAFPSTLGRVCGHPCENGCRRKSLDAALPIQSIHKTVSDSHLHRNIPIEQPNESAAERSNSPLCGSSAAIVGAGLTGLTAAFLLARKGVRVVVFDQADKPGGRLIGDLADQPDFVAAFEAEILRVWNQGVGWNPQTAIVSPDQLARLMTEFNAVLWAAGASSTAVLTPILDAWQVSPLQKTSKSAKTFRIARNLFIAGDALRGKNAPPVINAGDGRWSALAIARFLDGEDLTRYEQSGMRPWSMKTNALSPEELESMALAVEREYENRIMDDVADGLSEPFQPGQNGFDAPIGLAQEARRCLHCDCRAADDCRLKFWSERYQAEPEQWGRSNALLTVEFDDYGITRESAKCIDCGLCVQLANEAATENAATENAPNAPNAPDVHSGLAFHGRGFPVRIQVPFHDPLREAMSKETAQRCALACPTAAFHNNSRPQPTICQNTIENS